MKNLVIILSGGSGERLKSDKSKQFIALKGKTIIEHVIEKFEFHKRIEAIFLVVRSEHKQKIKNIIEKNKYKKIKKILPGGKNRQSSARIGIMAASKSYENILIHDAARPLVSSGIIDEVLDGLEKYQAVNVVCPVTNTILETKDNKMIARYLDRKFLKEAQTPQGFKVELIKKAHEMAVNRGFNDATDDCSLIIKYALADVYTVEGSIYNIKITYPLDIIIAEYFLNSQNL